MGDGCSPYRVSGSVTNLRRKKFGHVLDSLPPFRRKPKQYLKPARAVGYIKKCLILAYHRKVKKKSFTHVITFLGLSAYKNP
jgi:hypothetical protein